jgi:hypothetical protein
MVVVGSLQPNQPGVLQVVVVAVTVGRVVVTVGAGVAVVVVVGSLHPNQPGVLHVVVVAVLVGEVVVVVVVVVLSSRQPHHPGVSHVDVLVYDVVVEVVVVVVTSEPLLRKNFQRSQSKHSSSATHFGTVSYFKMTSDITFSIL